MAITVTSAAASKKLTTKETVKTELGISGSTDDTFIDTLIEQASALICSFAGRSFIKETVKETLPAFGGKRLVLSRVPVITVTAVKYGDDLITIPSTDYAVEDAVVGFLRHKTGVWDWTAAQTYGTLSAPVPGSEWAYYEVTYEGGYILASDSTRTLPYEVERACIDAVKGAYLGRKRDPNVSQESAVDVGSVTYVSGAGNAGAVALPPSSRSALEYYRRPTWG